MLTGRWALLALLCAVAGPALAGEPASAEAAAPTVEAAWVENVTATSANLRAKIDPHGVTSRYHFEYLTEAAYLSGGESFAGATHKPLGEGALVPGAGVPVFQHIEGLAPETVYYYRVVATNTVPETTLGSPRLLATEEPTNVHPPIDGRGWEMVSPVDKGGGAVGEPESLFGGGDFQAAASSAAPALTYGSATAFGEAAGSPPSSQYLSRRGEGGWSTQNVSVPLQSGGYGDEPDGAPYRLFSEDLARALLLNPRRCEAGEPCPRSYSRRDSASGVLTGLPAQAAGMRVLSASPDLGRILFEDEAEEVFAWSGGGLVPTDLLPPTAGVGAAFQAVSTDGRFTFYTEGGHLHRYDAVGGTAADLTPSGGVAGVLGASASGDTVYYQDGAGLKRWRSGTTITVAPGADAAASSDFPPATGTARVSADGQHLAFLSSAEIPPFDNLDANTGDPDSELYVYGPPPAGGAARLICASCNPTGERPHGSSTIPGAQVNGSTEAYKPRALSASGNRVFFDSSDRLVTADTDGRPDVYEWEAEGEGGCIRAPGCVGLISGGRADGGRFLDASADGTDAYFVSGESLVGADPGSIDAYDYRVSGGFPEPQQPIACVGDACQALPGEPEDPSPGTLVKNEGNPPLKYYSEHPHKHHPHRHKHKHRHKHHHGHVTHRRARR